MKNKEQDPGRSDALMEKGNTATPSDPKAAEKAVLSDSSASSAAGSPETLPRKDLGAADSGCAMLVSFLCLNTESRTTSPSPRSFPGKTLI